MTLLTVGQSPRPDIVDGVGIAFGTLTLTRGGAAVALGHSIRAAPFVFDGPRVEFTTQDRWALRSALAAFVGGPVLGFAVLLASTTSGQEILQQTGPESRGR